MFQKNIPAPLINVGGLSTEILIFSQSGKQPVFLLMRWGYLSKHVNTKQLKWFPLNCSTSEFWHSSIVKAPTQCVFLFGANFKEASLGGNEELINNQRFLDYLNAQKALLIIWDLRLEIWENQPTLYKKKIWAPRPPRGTIIK